MLKNNKGNTLIKSFKDLKKTKSIAIIGMLLALYLVIYSQNLSLTPLIEFRFGYLVLCLAGYIGGPFMGLVVGVLGDIISIILMAGKSSLPPFYGFTLSYAILGFGAGMIFYNSQLSTMKIALASILEFTISISLNTLWLSILSNMPFKTSLFMRLPKSTIMLFLNAIMLYVFMKTIAINIKKVLSTA